MHPYENRDNKNNLVLVYGLKTYGISKIIAALILISELNGIELLSFIPQTSTILTQSFD
jgi:hypothetical protein